jgi:inner membrane protein
MRFFGGDSMDTLTHGLIGIAVAGLSGHPASIHDPVYMASVLGAQAPDFDIIVQLYGNFSYIRQHRAFSHSIPGLVMWSMLISAGLSFLFSFIHWVKLFAWAFAGGLSHIIVDCLNTHGAAVLWPFCRKRKSLRLLNVFDPVLISLLCSVTIWKAPVYQLSLMAFALFLSYIAARMALRQRAASWLHEIFSPKKIRHIAIMPSLTGIFRWDFVLLTEKQHLVGQIGAFSPRVTIFADFPHSSSSSTLTQKAQTTFLGSFFSAFSPYVYFEEHNTGTFPRVNIYDLRYMVNRQFLHRATILFDQNNIPTASFMHSYGRTIKLPC